MVRITADHFRQKQDSKFLVIFLMEMIEDNLVMSSKLLMLC